MIVGYSFRDVLRHPEFAGMNQAMLLHPCNDDKIKSILFEVGADIKKPMSVQACLHRDSKNKVPEVGWRYVFYERRDREWLANRHSSLSVLIEGEPDLELRSDLIRMANSGFSYNSITDEAMEDEPVNRRIDPVGQLEEDYEMYVAQIKALQEIQKVVRGIDPNIDEDVFNQPRGSKQ